MTSAGASPTSPTRRPRDLAGSFRLENCVVRERLADILSAAAQPSQS